MRRIRVTDRASDTVLVEIDVDPAGVRHAVGDGPRGGLLVLPLGTPPIAVHATGRRQSVEVVVDGWRFELEVEDADRADLQARVARGRDAAAHDGPTEVRAIIPGRVVSVAVNPGDAVTAGDRLLAVEAMKMENEVRAPRDGIVERVAVGPGETVELGDVLVVIR
jgi:biotin carboxyl carrier protein